MTRAAHRCALALALGLAALGGETPPEAPLPDGPGPELPAAGADAGFRDLFLALAARGPVLANFTEYRWFAFRTAPVVLSGEMRFSRELGLSLHYVKPEERVVIADAGGLVLRDASGRSRSIQPDQRAPDIGGTLLPILRFDEGELFRAFHVRGARSGGAWRLDFVPRSAELARWVGTVTVEGTGDTLARIEFHRSSTQRIEIRVEAPATGVAFGAADRKRYFR
jgi:hypothetical protein